MSLTEEQLAVRMNGTGGSEIAAVAGLSPYAGETDVFLHKTRQAPPFVDTHHTKRGRHVEPAVIAWAAEEYGWLVRQCGTLVHRQYPRVIATPDGVIWDADGNRLAVLEVKCPGRHTEAQWGRAGTDDIPAHYRAQVTWEMAVTGLQQAHVVAYMDGDIHLYTVPYSAEFFDVLREVNDAFWEDYVLPKKRPPVDGSPTCTEYLQRMFPQRSEDIMSDESAELVELVRAHEQAREAAKGAATSFATAKQRLQEYLAESAGARGEWGSVYYRQQKPKKMVDWKTVAQIMGASDELIRAHTTEQAGIRAVKVYPAKG